jgi:serine/threonine protein kinase
MRYVGNKNIRDFLQDQSASERIPMIFECHLHLLKAIILLKTLDIIHNDIKSSNILYDITSGLPVLIDFKWASKRDALIFHKSPEQCTIEEFILSKIPMPADESKIFKEEELDEYVKEYASANQHDESYRTLLKEWLYIYRDKSHKDFYLETIQYAEFWDVYSIGQIMQSFANPIKEYNTVLYDLLHALPNTRMNAEDCLKRLDDIYKSVHYSDILANDSIGQNARFQPIINEPRQEAEPESQPESPEEPQPESPEESLEESQPESPIESPIEPKLELQNEQDIEHHIKEYNKLTKDEIVPKRIPST